MAAKKKVAAKAKGSKGAKDKMAKARAARGKGVGSKFSGMTTEALLKAKAQTPSEDKAAHYAIRRALRIGGYKISEHRVAKVKKGKGAAKAAVEKATKTTKAKSKTKAKAAAAKSKKSPANAKGDDWEDED